MGVLWIGDLHSIFASTYVSFVCSRYDIRFTFFQNLDGSSAIALILSGISCLLGMKAVDIKPSDGDHSSFFRE